MTRREAECLYAAFLYASRDDPDPDETLLEWLGGAERLAAAFRGAAKLRRCYHGPEQKIDEPEMADA